MSVEERGEFIIYWPDRVVVMKDIRYFDEKGELSTTGLIAEEVEIPEGGKVEDAIDEARRRLKDKLEKERERWRQRRRGEEK
jgi:hypothetical protein